MSFRTSACPCDRRSPTKFTTFFAGAIGSAQAMALAPNDPVVLYNAACTLAQLGEHDRALDGLERSIEAGVAVGDWIKHDPDFESLRDHPRFQAIVKRITPS